ncbi:MAG TPA: hypothetical protein PKK23_12925, partial [Nitrospirales bacterium]|nr:hypothetical protein [Nitrospirales bacterium]
RSAPTPAAGKLAALGHCPPFFRCRLHGAAMPPGQESLERKRESTRCAQTRSATDKRVPPWGQTAGVD